MLDTIIKEFCARVKENPLFILKIFLSKILSKSLSAINIHEISLKKEEIKVLRTYINEFYSGKPVAKIINEASFFGYEFFVNEDVLDPRMDTEVLVDSVLRDFPKNSPLKILDICTGSGVILLTLLKELPNTEGIGLDISEKALAVAEINRKKLFLEERARFIKSDFLLEILGGEYDHQFDVIVSNPPYIKTKDLASLDKTVKDYDPIIALDGGEDGTDAYQQILLTASPLLKSEGAIYFEIGYDILDGVINIAKTNNFYVEKVIKDLSGIDRVLKINKKTLKN